MHKVDSSIQNYLPDLVALLIERLDDEEKSFSESANVEDKAYIKGKAQAYYYSLLNLKEQATLFNIVIKNLETVNFEKYLVLKHP